MDQNRVGHKDLLTMISRMVSRVLPGAIVGLARPVRLLIQTDFYADQSHPDPETICFAQSANWRMPVAGPSRSSTFCSRTRI